MPLLERAGHRAVAMDLPCEDNGATFSDYADVVTRAVENADELVLVGHSLAGLTIPLVAARRPVRRLVFLCAVLPLPGRIPFGPDPTAPEATAPGLELVDHEDRTYTFTAASASTHLYNRCAPSDVVWATSRLRRQSRTPNRETCPLTVWPDAPRTYILASDDQIVLPDYARHVARSRGGIEPLEIDSDHSPFLSNATALARLLISLA